MVKTARQESDNEKLDRIITEQAHKHGCEVFKTGWSRITWEVFKRNPQNRDLARLAVVESFASTNGEIKLCAPEALAFVQDLGAQIEKEFPEIGEAVIVEDFPK